MEGKFAERSMVEEFLTRMVIRAVSGAMSHVEYGDHPVKLKPHGDMGFLIETTSVEGIVHIYAVNCEVKELES